MNILLANKFFFHNGGAERVFFQERKFLIDNGHRVIDFSMNDERNFPSEFSTHFVPNINYIEDNKLSIRIRNGLQFINSTIAASKISELIDKEKPVIAHLHNIYHQITPSIITGLKRNNVKIILTLHDYKLICPSYLALRDGSICNECSGKKFWKPISTRCQDSIFKNMLISFEAFYHKFRQSYDMVDLFIAPSKFIADYTSQRIKSKKIRVLHNGIDIDRYRPNFSDQGYVLYFGRLSKEKGIETLLKAHRTLANKFTLKIIGTGPLEGYLQREYPAAEFYGYKYGQELDNLISNAAFVVVPSEWYENCSMVVLEAMAFGKPVIGSRIGGIPEQINDGETGLLFEMGNSKELSFKIEHLINNPQLRRKMGEAGRIKAEIEYSLEDHNNNLLEIYSHYCPNILNL